MRYLAYSVLFSVLLGGSAATRDSGEAEAPQERNEEPGTFVPTEKVPADSAVSFPADI